jgi:hypothetical protein
VVDCQNYTEDKVDTFDSIISVAILLFTQSMVHLRWEREANHEHAHERREKRTHGDVHDCEESDPQLFGEDLLSYLRMNTTDKLAMANVASPQTVLRISWSVSEFPPNMTGNSLESRLLKNDSLELMNVRYFSHCSSSLSLLQYNHISISGTRVTKF